jgi:signal transduction histidine kinase
MKKYFCILSLCLTFLSVYSQSTPRKLHYADSVTQAFKKQLDVTHKRFPDSLAYLATHTPSDSIRARNFLRLSLYWRDLDSIKAKNYLAKGFKYGAKYPYVKAIYYHYLAAHYYPTNTPKSEENYMEADKQFSKFTSEEAFFFRAKGWGNYANLQQKKGNELLMADILLNKCIPLIKKAGINEFLAKYYNDLGEVFMNQQQHDKAEKYFHLAIATYEKMELWDITHLFDAYLGASENYLLSNKIAEAKKKLDKAKNILPKCRDTISHTQYYLIESIFYRKTKAYSKGIESIESGLKIAKQAKEPYEEEALNSQKYKILTEEGHYQEAASIIENILKKPASKSSNDHLTWYKDLSALYNKMGNSKMAYKWIEKYSVLSDSSNKQDVLHKINLLEIKFKTVENEKKIISLNAENRQTALLIKNNKLTRSLLIGSCICLFLIAVAIVVYFKKSTIQKEKNLQQKARELAQTQQIAVSKAMLDAEEKERNRVAKDLHDGLGGMLAVSKINLAHYAQENKNTDADLHNVITQLGNSMGELRRIAHNMMPEMLLKLGLEASLRDLCETVASETLKVTFHYLGISNNLKAQEQINIYRIVQEAIANATKHSDAQNLLLQCSQNENIFFITIEDDGKGFDTNHINNFDGIGLSNIKSRVEYLKGKIEILSGADKKGTSINIELYVTN